MGGRRPAVPPGIGGSEGEFWADRYHDAVDWALRLRDALDDCRQALDAAGSTYEPPAGWELLLTLPEL